MNFFSRLLNRFFSQSGRDDDRLVEGMNLAKAGDTQKAIDIYNSLIDATSAGAVVRARALFNRALAYSSLKDDAQAAADLKQVLAMPNLPENVQTAARAQLARVSKRQTDKAERDRR
jgi:tetratricopeptide (TPR) repeat protein